MKARIKKKNIRRNAERMAEKLPLALPTKADKKAFVDDIVRRHPALVRKKEKK